MVHNLLIVCNFLVILLEILNHILYFLVRDKGSLNPGGLLIAGRIEQHISFAKKLLCPVHIYDRPGIHSR